MTATGACDSIPAPRATGLPPPVARPAGVSIPVDAADCLVSGHAEDRAMHALACVLAEGFEATIRVTGLERTEPVQAFGELCKLVQRAAVGSGADPERIAIAVDAHDIRPECAWALRRNTLGRGMLYLVGTDARPGSDDVLRRLFRLRFERCVGAAFWPLVTSPGPLLDNECGDDVMPVRGLQAPARSAWVTATVDVRHCVAGGVVDWSGYDALLAAALDAADEEHTRCRWPCAASRHDAWLNRRIAIELVGIGDWVSKSQPAPCSLDALSAVDALIARAASRLKAQSRRMASGNTLPAIAARDPCRRLPKGSDGDAWRQRWQFAIERAGLGHRNLLAVSPWSLFEDRRADVRAFNLLPALRHADACTFARQVSIEHWGVDEFLEFHRRAWAVMRRNARPSLVAEQI